MSAKTAPLGICDYCGQPFPPHLSWHTRRGPRRYCSVECRNTANSRAGNPLRTAKLRQAVAEGRWRNPAKLRPPTSAEQSARSRKGRLREVAEGRWRNPALNADARRKLSRPRKHASDPTLHQAIEKLRSGKMTDLTPEERERYLAYRNELRHAQRSQRTPEEAERLRAAWRAAWHKRNETTTT